MEGRSLARQGVPDQPTFEKRGLEMINERAISAANNDARRISSAANSNHKSHR